MHVYFAFNLFLSVEKELKKEEKLKQMARALLFLKSMPPLLLYKAKTIDLEALQRNHAIQK